MNEIQDQLEKVVLGDDDSQKLSEGEEEEDPQGLFGAGGGAGGRGGGPDPLDADAIALAALRASMAATAAHVDPFMFGAPRNPLGPFWHPPPGGGGIPHGYPYVNLGGLNDFFVPPGGGGLPPGGGGSTQR